VYFLTKGTCAYVLPRYDNKLYLIIPEGKRFGHVELVADQKLVSNEDASKTIMMRSYVYKDLTRLFTVRAYDNCELLAL